MIIPIHATYTPTYPSVETASYNTVTAILTMAVTILLGGSCYSAQQAVSKFSEHHIDMVSCVHRKCRTRAGISIYQSLNQSYSTNEGIETGT